MVRIEILMIYIIHQERDRNYKIAAGLSVQRRLRRLDRLDSKERQRVGCLEVEMSYFFFIGLGM